MEPVKCAECMRIKLPVCFLLFFWWGLPSSFSQTKASVQGRFVENRGQWPREVMFRASFPGADVFILKSSIKYVFHNRRHKQDQPERSRSAHDARLSASGELPVMQVVEVKFAGANEQPVVSGYEPGEVLYNYFLGADPSRWAGGLHSYRRVKLGSLYDGIDLELREKEGRLKYDIIVRAGADPSVIRMVYDGHSDLRVDGRQLVVQTALGEIREKQPVTFQETGAGRREIPCSFTLKENGVRFKIGGAYDPGGTLVIDPELIFSTYSGSYDDNWGFTATYDDEGNLFAGGIVEGQEFPVTNGAYQTTYGGGAWDVAILKFDSSGTDLHYATFLGGSFSETPQSLVVNHEGELLIYGTTSSPDFPLTPDAFQKDFKGGRTLDDIFNTVPALVGGIPFDNGSDLYIARLSRDGSHLLASTLAGGTGNDGLSETLWPLTKNYGDQFRGEIIVDDDDNVYVATVTSSPDFPVPGGFQTVYAGGHTDGVVMKFNKQLSDMIWGTFIGGTLTDGVHSLRLDRARNVFVGGGTNSTDYPVTPGTLKTEKPDPDDVDGVVSLISADGSRLLRSTYIGTAAYDQVYLIDTDSAKNLYMLGQTRGAYEVTPGVYSNPGSGQFIHKIGHDLDTTYYSTVIGSGSGSPDFRPTAFLVNECENILLSGWGGILNREVNNLGYHTGYVGGSTKELPVSPNAFQTYSDGSDFYLMVLLKDAKTLLYATFFGELGGFEHVDGGTSRFDKRGIVYQAVCGSCGGRNNFPTTPGAWSNTNNSKNCNNAAFKFDLSSLIARFDTNTPEFDQPGIRSGCYPLDLIFINESIGGESYFWDFGNGDTTSQADMVEVTYEDPGVYEVVLTATDINTCTRVSKAHGTITVHDYDFSIMDPDSICYGDAIKLYAGGGVDYTWEPAESLSNPHVAEPVATPDTTTVYTVNVTDANGCAFEDSVEISVVPEIVADFEIEKRYDCLSPAIFHFKNLSERAKDFFWDFGDGNTSVDFEPVHQYAASDTVRTFAVELTASASFCSEDKTEEVRTVQPFIPNFVSPNGDGKNDRFVVRTDHRVKLRIFNRLGRLEYSNDAYQDEWPEEGHSIGVYYYEITFFDQKTTCKGWVEIRR